MSTSEIVSTGATVSALATCTNAAASKPMLPLFAFVAAFISVPFAAAPTTVVAVAVAAVAVVALLLVGIVVATLARASAMDLGWYGYGYGYVVPRCFESRERSVVSRSGDGVAGVHDAQRGLSGCCWVRGPASGLALGLGLALRLEAAGATMTLYCSARPPDGDGMYGELWGATWRCRMGTGRDDGLPPLLLLPGLLVIAIELARS